MEKRERAERQERERKEMGKLADVDFSKYDEEIKLGREATLKAAKLK